MKYAIIENERVVNVAIADAPLASNWVPAGNFGIGDKYSGGSFEQAPVVVDINAEREAKIKSGMSYKFPDGDGIVNIHVDRDIINIIGLGVAALQLYLSADTTTLLTYRDEANVNHKMTATETINFGMAFMRWYSDQYKDSWDKKDAL